MSGPHRLARALPVFSIAFVVLYYLAVQYNLALFTYHPRLKQFGFLVQPVRAGPAMYWYGWLLTSALGALAIAALSLMVPERWTARIWPALTWLAPLAVIVLFVILLRGYFLR